MSLHLSIFSLLLTASATMAAPDPIAAVYERMTLGIQVGHFDHDQDRVPAAEVNSEYLDSVKAAGFKSIRLFINSDKAPAFYADNVSYALKQGLVVNLCMFVWNSVKTKEEYGARWKSVADYYKNYPEELVFEMFNEPALSPKLTDNAVVMEWINAAIVAVRAVSPKRILLVGGPQFMQAQFLRYVSPEHLTSLATFWRKSEGLKSLFVARGGCATCTNAIFRFCQATESLFNLQNISD